jgi:hypothetical protein
MKDKSNQNLATSTQHSPLNPLKGTAFLIYELRVMIYELFEPIYMSLIRLKQPATSNQQPATSNQNKKKGFAPTASS